MKNNCIINISFLPFIYNTRPSTKAENKKGKKDEEVEEEEEESASFCLEERNYL